MNTGTADRHDFIAVMAFDLADGGRKLGEGTKERCSKGLALYYALLNKGGQGVILTAAGFANKAEAPDQRFTLATMMEAFLVLQGADENHCEVLNEEDRPRVWGSKAEMQVFEKYLASQEGEHILHVISHWWHIPRLWLVARRMNCAVIFHPSPESHSAMWRELYKIPAQFVLNVLGK